MGRRGKNEGSITKRKDGRWQGAITLGYKWIDGKRKIDRMFIYGKTRPEVANKLKLLLADQQRGKLISPQEVTLGHYLDEWLKSKEASVARNTYIRYGYGVRYAKEIGDIKVQELSRSDIQDLINKKSKELAASTMTDLRWIISSALELAIEDDVIHKNVSRSVEVPRRTEKNVYILSKDEMTAILTACFGTYVYDVVYLEYATGMRRGEILGLEWSDIDFKNNTIDVNKSYVMYAGQADWSDVNTKTEAGNRVVAILPETTAWIKLLKDKHPNTKYVYESSRGGRPYNPTAFYKKYKKFITEIGLGHITFHDLRHNYATKLMANNVHTSLVQGQLGQKDTKTTKRYMHAVLSARKKAIENLRNELPLM